MNKQERIQTIETIRKRTKPARILSAVFAAGAFLVVHLFDQSIWSILVLVFALIVSGMILRRESLQISRLSESTQAKRLIQLRSTIGFGMISILLLLIMIPQLIGDSDLPILYLAGFMILAIAIETYLERRIRQADPEQPMSKEYR